MSNTSIDEISTVARDVAYVSVGLGILAFQRLQVRRQELKKAVEARVGSVRGSR